MATVRVLAIIGSGETSPTMVTVHRGLVSRIGLASPQAMVLATPYAFQENAADVSARTQRYFADSVGLQVRVGLHAGECEVLDGKVAGIAVAIGARVSARAGAGEVLVSQTVKDLVAGSGIGFDDRGLAELKGVPGQWRLYAVASP